ncbi:hypothetical protein GCM10022224_093250 [Nonomuraea antimicrobica]|uniref:Uncharacterized protein n=1 Tax=Nonomuraea antimicrobica TaxID=561173 RepID=A0ABP7E4L0_9ACTN
MLTRLAIRDPTPFTEARNRTGQEPVKQILTEGRCVPTIGACVFPGSNPSTLPTASTTAPSGWAAPCTA